jgi:DNA-directed RNA polymerase II subunit RPB2
MNLEIPWEIIDKYFTDNKSVLIQHQLNSYNDFFDNGIKRIFKEKNPIKILKQQNPETKNYDYRANIYLGGKEGDQIYYGKPIIFDDDREHYMYPNIARLRNMTYAITIHYDVFIEYFITEDGETTETQSTLEKIFLGRFPIMLNSNLCILNGLSPEVKFNMGECKNDLGGYFIIDGKEKVIVSQEKFADNMIYIRDDYNEIYSTSCEVRSVSEDASKPVRTVSIRMVKPTSKFTHNNMVVNIPNVRKPIPLFILMRALGVISDKKIIEYCLLDLEKYQTYMELFIPSIHDASRIFTQVTAIKYIATFTKGKTVPHVLEILMNYFLPHIGENNFTDKAYYIGHMVKELLKVFTKENKPTDRDSFKYKRVDITGYLLYDLFKEYYTLQQRNIFQTIDKEYYYKQGLYQKNFTALIDNNHKDIFKERIVENGFKKAFKGNWGSEAHTKRAGVVQDLNRLSFNSYISHLRKINLPLDSALKIVGPRLLHGSQWGLIDPVDTPDGGNIGFHKHMAMSTYITSACSKYPLIFFLKNSLNLKLLTECSTFYISQNTKVFVNGDWIGVVEYPIETIENLKHHKRLGLISIYTSIVWEKETNIIYLYTDSGRLTRPLFYIDEKTPSYRKNKEILDKLLNHDFTWSQLLTGFNNQKYDITNCNVYQNISDLYGVSKIDSLTEKEGIIEYLDTSEEEGALICIDEENINKLNYTNLEIHPSLIFGVMGNLIAYPENSQLPRDLFSCGQSKQAVSVYHSNYLNRIDKSGLILNYGQIPLIKSRYLKYINNEQHPYGVNAIVAIGVYGSYNVEDSVLFNQGSIDRGIFRTTYFNSYETREESSKVGNSTIDSKFVNIEQNNVIGLKPGYDYANLDQYGLVKENTPVDEKSILIGKVTSNLADPNTYIDDSISPKKGQYGYVDKSFITEGAEGFRIAKVRVREERIPAIGDKFCSRCGQKGTIGLVIPEESMPFTSNGIRPDIIINPHALPSRMTISQLIECLAGKACAEYGAFGDATAFINKGPKNKLFGQLLSDVGYSSTGNELLYNGETGEQLEAEIFIGPTYYMRLKHMVKDKINSRAKGPRTVLTRQTVQGRANEGGLRIGEMERDVIIAHGMAEFLYDSLITWLFVIRLEL